MNHIRVAPFPFVVPADLSALETIPGFNETMDGVFSKKYEFIDGLFVERRNERPHRLTLLMSNPQSFKQDVSYGVKCDVGVLDGIEIGFLGVPRDFYWGLVRTAAKRNVANVAGTVFAHERRVIDVFLSATQEGRPTQFYRPLR